jgi:hypothetical protein
VRVPGYWFAGPVLMGFSSKNANWNTQLRFAGLVLMGSNSDIAQKY